MPLMLAFLTPAHLSSANSVPPQAPGRDLMLCRAAHRCCRWGRLGCIWRLGWTYSLTLRGAEPAALEGESFWWEEGKGSSWIAKSSIVLRT